MSVKTIEELEVGDFVSAMRDSDGFWVSTHWVVSQVLPRVGVLTVMDNTPRLIQDRTHFMVEGSRDPYCNYGFRIEDLVRASKLAPGDCIEGFFDSLGYWRPIPQIILVVSVNYVHTTFEDDPVTAYAFDGQWMCLPRRSTFANSRLAEKFRTLVSSL